MYENLQPIQLDDIDTEGGTQARAVLDEVAIQEYAEAMAEEKPARFWGPLRLDSRSR